jgi:flavodoxin
MMKTLVIFDSEFGNTRKVAEAVGAAILGADVVFIKDVKPEALGKYDCVIVGAPTQRLNFTEGMGEFLDAIPPDGLKGVKVAAFDTRISIPDIKGGASRFAARMFLHRYAAKPIAAKLNEKGGIEVTEPEGFFVLDTEGPLKDGELERAAAWAKGIAQAVNT